MKRIPFYLYTFLSICLLLLLAGCHESNPEKDNIFQRLKATAKINTFSLTIITSDRLNDNAFPEDLKILCALSTSSDCKTLPDGGILRLGPNVFHTYNCISEIKISDSIENNETAVTGMVNEKVKDYYSKTKLKDYDSLLTPNRSDWNIRSLILTYIDNTTADSIFFFSNKPNDPVAIRAGNKVYNVYTNSDELRKQIDRLVCKGTGAISVFYNAHSLDSLAAATTNKTNWPKKDTYAGDTCFGYSKHQKLHDGNGGFKIGDLLDSNSKSCGYIVPTGIAGDTCVKGSKYQKIHDGRGGFRVGSIIERNSKSCGFMFPEKGSRVTGFIYYNGAKYEKLNDGNGGFMRGNLTEEKKPVKIEEKKPIRIEEKKPIKKVIPEPVVPKTKKPPVVTVPQRETPDNNKNGNSPKPALSNKRCASTSEEICEKDRDGNYTGRRVQYCYDKSGHIIQTVVVSKCDADCRCL